MLSRFFSKENSGVCTPIVTRPASRYFSDHARTYGSVRNQLMHVYVQKSTATTFPRSSSTVSGEEFSHDVAPLNEPSSPSAGSGTTSSYITPPIRSVRQRLTVAQLVRERESGER